MPSAEQFEWPQGQPLFEEMWVAVTESLAGNGIVSNGDFAVTATATALEIQVAPGTYFYVGANHTLGAAETHVLSAGDANNDRWDTVYFDTATDTTGVREGTPGTDPEPPEVQADEAPLAFVYVAQNASDVTDAEILNWRGKFSNEAEETHYEDTTGVYGVNNVAAALDELQEAAQITAYPLAPGTDLGVNAYPWATGDIASDAVTSAEIATGAVGTDQLDASLSITWTGEHTFDSHQTLQEVATPSTPSSGYAQLYPKADGFIYSQDDAGQERRVGGDVKTASISSNYTTQGEDILFVDPSGTGGLIITLATADTYDGHGVTIIDAGGSAEANPITIDTEGTETIDGEMSNNIATDSAQFLLESDGNNWFTSGGAAAVGVNTDEFNTDESGTVTTGNSGIVYAHSVPNQGTFRVLRAGLLLADGQGAPTDLDLIIASLDGSGGATKQANLVVGDGTVQATVTGDPVAEYQNTSGAEQTVAVLVDNGNFNTGTGANQDIVADAQGEVV